MFDDAIDTTTPINKDTFDACLMTSTPLRKSTGTSTSKLANAFHLESGKIS